MARFVYGVAHLFGLQEYWLEADTGSSTVSHITNDNKKEVYRSLKLDYAPTNNNKYKSRYL